MGCERKSTFFRSGVLPLSACIHCTKRRKGFHCSDDSEKYDVGRILSNYPTYHRNQRRPGKNNQSHASTEMHRPVSGYGSSRQAFAFLLVCAGHSDGKPLQWLYCFLSCIQHRMGTASSLPWSLQRQNLHTRRFAGVRVSHRSLIRESTPIENQEFDTRSPFGISVPSLLHFSLSLSLYGKVENRN